MGDVHWVAFLGAVVLISASPGPAMALILRRSALGGFRGGVATVLGLEAGIYCWALLAAAGVAGLVAASEAAYIVLRVVGAGVLVYLGVKALKGAWLQHQANRAGRETVADTPVHSELVRPSFARSFSEGLLVQLANPKAAVFMIAFYPQFVPSGEPFFLTTAYLGLAQVLLETFLYLCLAASVASAGAWFRRPLVRTRLDAVTGCVLIALGFRVASHAR